MVPTRGPSRTRILEKLQSSPHNANQLAQVLGMDYRTVRHHLRVLERNGLVGRPVGNHYAAPYELSPQASGQFELILQIRDAAPSSTRRRAPLLEGQPGGRLS
ncbi:MAG: winged helix-turn-helix domain-containing protein [Thermoplasmata archaeon]|nr:winged helix-turn-helix domain-containing protein [Thermoplasmata archaeon]